MKHKWDDVLYVRVATELDYRDDAHVVTYIGQVCIGGQQETVVLTREFHTDKDVAGKPGSEAWAAYAMDENDAAGKTLDAFAKRIKEVLAQ